MSTQPLALKNPYYVLEFTITIMSILFQLGNCTWSLVHAYAKPRYNSLVCLSMFIYLFAFIPLLRSTGITTTDVYDPLDSIQREMELKYMNNLHNVFFCIATLLYTIVIQSRLQCIRVMANYPKWIDHCGLLITFVVWCYLCLVHVIILPFIGSSNPILYGGIWSVYVVLVDNLVAFVFLQKLLVSRSDLGLKVSKRQLKRRQRLIWTLVILAMLTWISLIFPFLGITAYKNNPEIRRLTYRIGFCFSPVMYFGALLFVYSVQAIFCPLNDEEISSFQSEVEVNIQTGHKDYHVYIAKDNKY